MYRIINGYYIGLKNGIGTSNQWVPEMAIDIISRSFFSAWLVNCKRHGRSPRGLSTINCRSVRGDSGPWDLWVFSMTYSVRKLPPSHCPQLPCGSSLDWSKKGQIHGKIHGFRWASILHGNISWKPINIYQKPPYFVGKSRVSGFDFPWTNPMGSWKCSGLCMSYPAWGEYEERERESILCILIHQHSPTSILFFFFFFLLLLYIYII